MSYRELAKEREAAALRGRDRVSVERALTEGGDRLFRWRGTRSKWDRRYAARAYGWACEAVARHCK